MAAIIFDFDGTIADSFDYVATLLIKGAKLSPDNQRKQELRSLSMTAMARRLGYKWWQLPFMFLTGRRKMGDIIKQLRPFDGIPAVIQELHSAGHELFIVSSNSSSNIQVFLRHHDLQNYFAEIYGGVGLFGKASALRRLLKRHHLQPAETTYIGDELRDVEAAQSIKLPVIAVSWGFARTADLQALRPTALARTSAELADILRKR